MRRRHTFRDSSTASPREIEIVISRAGKPIARLVPIGALTRQLGRDQGVFTVPSDFDYPLPEGLLADFEREGPSSLHRSASASLDRALPEPAAAIAIEVDPQAVAAAQLGEVILAM